MTYVRLRLLLRTPSPSYPALDFWERALHITQTFSCACKVVLHRSGGRWLRE